MDSAGKPWYSKAAFKLGMKAAITIVPIAIYIVYPYVKGHLPSEKRDKAIALHNAFAQQNNEFAKHWNQYIALRQSKTATVEGLVQSLVKAKDALEEIDPFCPIGVDPGLSTAVCDHKAAAIERLKYLLGLLNKSHPSDNQRYDYLDNSERVAFDKIRIEFNRIASEVGGIQSEPARIPLFGDVSPETKKDCQLLQGDWKFTSVKLRGKADESNAPMFWLIKGDQIIKSNPDGHVETYRLDATQKPKLIELYSDGNLIFAGIYKLDGNELKVCLGKPDNPPSEFIGDRGYLLLSMRRQ